MNPVRTSLMRRLVVVSGLATLLASCATPPPAPPPAPPTPPPHVSVPVVPTLTAEELEALQRQRLRELSAKAASPEPPLTLATQCRFRDEMGYRGALKMTVRDAEVKQLEAEVTIPKHGNCHFRLRDFEQTERAPSILLAARGDACQVHVWSKDKEATVAFRGCSAQCTNGSHEYLWPILVRMDKKNTCS